jgi:feruloyl esterase
VQAPLGLQGGGEVPALARGFAIVSTDSGHKGANFDAGFFADQEATLNFLYLAVGKVTVVAKQIIASYYGRPIDHSYFVGCSTGGREAMIMSQRYPRYFDGVVAGAPAIRTGFSNLGMRWVSVALSQADAKVGVDKPVPGSALSGTEKKLIVDSALRACDGKDGLEDGMISNPRGCDFDPAVLTCKDSKTDQCLNANQIRAVKKAMSGAKDSKGGRYTPAIFTIRESPPPAGASRAC